MRENRHFNKGNNKEQRVSDLPKLPKATKPTPRKHDYTASRGTYEREKETQKRPKITICNATTSTKRPIIRHCKQTSATQTRPNIAPASTKPRKTPKLRYEFLQKWSGCRLCRGCAAFSQKKKFQRISQHTTQTPIIPSKERAQPHLLF